MRESKEEGSREEEEGEAKRRGIKEVEEWIQN